MVAAPEAGPSWGARLLREGKAAASLRHPNIVAVFAMSAVISGTASAAFKKEYEKRKGGTYTAIALGESVATAGQGTLALQSNGVEVECSGKVEGTVKSKGEDTVTNIFEVAGSKVIKCTLINGAGLCTTPVTAEAVNLTWDSQLLEVGTELRNELKTGGSGNPGWKVKCGNGLTNTCTAAKGNTAVKNVEVGGVGKIEDTFDAKTEEAKCTLGKGTVRKTVTTEPSAAEKTAGVTGIKAV